MTDKEKLEQLLTSFGVGWKDGDKDHPNSIVCKANEANIGGYEGFEAHFQFKTDGAFEKMVIWE